MSDLRRAVLKMQTELLDLGFETCTVWRLSEQTWAVETSTLTFNKDLGIAVRLFAYAGDPVIFAQTSNPAPKAGMSLDDMLVNIKYVLANRTAQGMP